MDNIVSEGINLMVFGMGFVFVFLTLLVFATSAMSKFVGKYVPEAVPAAKPAAKRAATAPTSGSNDELVAVIAAAVRKHRS